MSDDGGEGCGVMMWGGWMMSSWVVCGEGGRVVGGCMVGRYGGRVVGGGESVWGRIIFTSLLTSLVY